MLYLYCILIGTPLFFISSIFATLAPELSLALGSLQPVSAAQAMLYFAVGVTFGDLASGLLSQYLKSRKKVIACFMPLCFLCACGLLLFGSTSSIVYSTLCGAAGFFVGYWVLVITISAEQFGTNIRATAATTIPNFIRGMTVPMTLFFSWGKPYLGIPGSAALTGLIVFLLAGYSLTKLRETYGVDLNFVELPKQKCEKEKHYQQAV